MKQDKAERIADEIVGRFRSAPISYREAIIEGLLEIKECDGCPSMSQALNEGDGVYRP